MSVQRSVDFDDHILESVEKLTRKTGLTFDRAVNYCISVGLSECKAEREFLAQAELRRNERSEG